MRRDNRKLGKFYLPPWWIRSYFFRTDILITRLMWWIQTSHFDKSIFTNSAMFSIQFLGPEILSIHVGFILYWSKYLWQATMRSIQPKLISVLNKNIDPKSVSASPFYEVNSYRDLVQLTAKLSYVYIDQLFFFRGQTKDYLNKAGSSTFYPSIYRGDYLPFRERKYRFEVLNEAASQLRNIFKEKSIEGYQDVRRRKIIQWSILQHYGVCTTPLLDFTH